LDIDSYHRRLSDVLFICMTDLPGLYLANFAKAVHDESI
jgi:hypothetical protein